MQIMDSIQEFFGSIQPRNSGRRREGIIAVAILVAMVPLDVLQVDYMLFGAFCLVCFDAWMNNQTPVARKGKAIGKSAADERQHLSSYMSGSRLSGSISARAARSFDEASNADSSVCGDTARRKPRLPKPVAKAERISQFASPSMTPTGMGWTADVGEFVKSITPCSQTTEFTEEIARRVKQTLGATLHDIEVFAYANGSVLRESMYCGEVPDVDIVVRVSQDSLIRDSQSGANVGFLLKKRNQGLLDETKLYKSVLRTCTEKLSWNGFKFVGSMFRGYEPNLQLLAPVSAATGESVQMPIVLGINSIIPSFVSSLMATCNRIAPSAAALIQLVRRWAKDRNISYAPRGYLPPFHWSLLVVHFLQVRRDGPVLPKLKVVKSSDGYEAVPASSEAPCQCKDSPATLFKEFVYFYSQECSFHSDLISMSSGVRLKNHSFQPRIVHHSDGVQSDVTPTIEDPFNPKQALATPMTWTSLSRTKEELARADELCSSGASLAELMTPWLEPDEDSTPIVGASADQQRLGSSKSSTFCGLGSKIALAF